MEKARAAAPGLERIVYWGGGAPDALDALMAQPGYEAFTACDTASDDVCLIGFTSGTTGEPKGTMHFHRDMLATCDSYGRHVLRAEASDRFIGSPPLAFTFGLGGLRAVSAARRRVHRPAREGAARRAARGDRKTPRDHLLHGADRLPGHARPSSPTHDISSLRKCVSAGEALPKATFEAWQAATGIEDHGRHRRDRDAAHLHRLARGRDPAGRDRPAGAGLRGAHPRRRRHARCARHARPARGARADRLPLSRRQPADGNTCRTAGTSPATPM